MFDHIWISLIYCALFHFHFKFFLHIWRHKSPVKILKFAWHLRTRGRKGLCGTKFIGLCSTIRRSIHSEKEREHILNPIASAIIIWYHLNISNVFVHVFIKLVWMLRGIFVNFQVPSDLNQFQRLSISFCVQKLQENWLYLHQMLPTAILDRFRM